jgi:hypothetical protein
MSTQPNVKSFTVQDASGESLRLSVSTDIVDYMDSARTFGREDLADPNAHGRFQRRLIAIPDRKAEVVTPMVLSIGSQNGLYLVRKDEGAAGDGWKLIDLGPALEQALGGKPQIRAMHAAWTDDDRIAVAVAVDTGAANAPSRVFVAYNLSSKSDWSNIAWTDCGTRERVRVTGIRVLDEGDGTWTVVLDGSAGSDFTLFLLRSNQPGPFNQAPVFSPAVDYQEMFDFDVLVDPYVSSGIVVLGQSGRTRVLSFRPFPTYDRNGRLSNVPPTVPLPCPSGANTLGTGLTRNGGTDLYIGGQGVHRIVADELDNQDVARVEVVMSAEAAPDVQQLAIADAADGSIAVWALRQNGDLLVGRRGAGTDSATGWVTPLRVRQGVQEIAPVRGDQHATTSLLVVYTDGTAGTLLLDAGTGVWRESPLLVANPNEVAAVSCYGTAIRMLDDGGMPRVSTTVYDGDVPRVIKTVKVSASVLSSVILNNRAVFIGPGLEVETETDQNGSVHLYDRARSLTPAVYRFTLDGVDGSLDVNPAGGIHDQFRAMTADQLRDATVTTVSGETSRLLPEELRTGAQRSQVDGMASALNQAASLVTQASNGPVAGQTATATDGIAGVSWAAAGTPFSSALKPQAVPANYQWGIVADGNGVRPAPQQQIQQAVASASTVEGFFADLGQSIADFFEGIWDRIKEGWLFVVRKAEEAFEFICALGGKIKKFVLSTLEQLGSFFTWLWDQVKTGLEKLWSFLKFVFNWDDILVARDVMVSATDEALKYLKASTGTLKKGTEEGFGHLIGEIRRWQADVGIPPATLPPPEPGTSFSTTFKQASKPALDLLDQATGNSVVGWVLDRVNGLFDEIVHIEGPDPATVAIEGVKEFLTNLVDDEYKNLVALAKQVQADVVRIFDGKRPDTGQWSFDTLKNLVVAVGADAVVGLITMVRDLVLRMIDLLGTMIDVMRAAMFAKISFPFIEKLVELVAPGTHLDTSFRLIDALMLLVSIPSTIAYKLIFNEAPFRRGQPIDLPFGRVAVQADVIAAFKPYAGIAAAFFKMVVAGYGAGKAFSTPDVEPPKVLTVLQRAGIILGMLFAGGGVAALVMGRYEREGDVVATLEWCGIAAAAAAAWITAGSGVIMVGEGPARASFRFSEKMGSGFDAASTVIQLGLGAAIFGVIMDKLGRSSVHYDRVRQLPETCRFIALVLDLAGTILADVAIVLPMAAAKAKGILVGAGAVTKGGALTYKILEVTSTKDLLGPLPKPVVP